MGVFAFTALCASSLLTIIDPIAAAPLFVATTATQSPAERRRTAVRATAVALALLCLFAAAGGAIFRLFGITIEAFRIAGGILFFTMALPMLSGARSAHPSQPDAHADDPAIVPLGMPIIAGPGAISTVMVLMGQADGLGQALGVYVAIAIACGVTVATLWLAPSLLHRLGRSGIALVTRVLGLIMCVIGIQFVIDGLRPVVIEVIRAARLAS
ncbi:MAG: MarC family protein [Nannocystaceae bacterium]|jgi:multiple antibiotic resistance protein